MTWQDFVSAVAVLVVGSLFVGAVGVAVSDWLYTTAFELGRRLEKKRYDAQVCEMRTNLPDRSMDVLRASFPTLLRGIWLSGIPVNSIAPGSGIASGGERVMRLPDPLPDSLRGDAGQDGGRITLMRMTQARPVRRPTLRVLEERPSGPGESLMVVEHTPHPIRVSYSCGCMFGPLRLAPIETIVPCAEHWEEIRRQWWDAS